MGSEEGLTVISIYKKDLTKQINIAFKFGNTLMFDAVFFLI